MANVVINHEGQSSRREFRAQPVEPTGTAGLRQMGRRLGLRAVRVFRDETNLAVNSDLWGAPNNPPTRRAVRRVSAMLSAVAISLLACTTPPADVSQRPEVASRPLASRSYATTAQVLDAVKAARDIQTLPAAAAAQLTKIKSADPTDARHAFDCQDSKPAVPSNHFGECTFGDPHGTKLMVTYGDSQADMWAAALEGVAAKHGWKLREFTLDGCPAPDLHFLSYTTRTPNQDCDKFHDAAPQAIRELHPDVVILTSMGDLLLDGTWPTSTQWRDGWISTLQKLTQPDRGASLVLLGDVPSWENNDARCLAAHVNDVQKCSTSVPEGTQSLADEQSAAAAAGALYVSPQPWFCTDQCEPVIADKVVYHDVHHITQPYAEYLTGALGEALRPVLDRA
jgi:hypothetical protein